MSTPGAFGDGTLSQIAKWVYHALSLMFATAIAHLPAVLWWLALDLNTTNIAFYVFGALPIAPSLNAALYAHRIWLGARDRSTLKFFIKGYRMGVAQTFKWWIPVLLVAAVLTVNVTFQDAVSGGENFVLVSLVLGVALGIWSLYMVVITSVANCRTRDAARLAVMGAGSYPATTLSYVSTLILLGASIYFFSELLTLLIFTPFFVLLIHSSSPRLVADTIKRFS